MKRRFRHRHDANDFAGLLFGHLERSKARGPAQNRTNRVTGAAAHTVSRHQRPTVITQGGAVCGNSARTI